MVTNSETVRAEKNPIIPNSGVCDPHMRIMGGRCYLYATHDYSPENERFRMKDWHVWSSGDLVEWRHESTFRPEETYIGASDHCWAPDAIERNGW